MNILERPKVLHVDQIKYDIIISINDYNYVIIIGSVCLGADSEPS